MTLPVLSLPRYVVDLPSGGKASITPFHSGQSKSLLKIDQSDELEIGANMLALVKDCVVEGFSDDLTISDVMYIFIQMRKISIGAESIINVRCMDDDTISNAVTLDLGDYEIVPAKEMDDVVEINAGIFVKLRPLTFKDVAITDPILRIRSCIVSIFDKNTVYDITDYSDEQFIEWFSNVTLSDELKMSAIMANQPDLVLLIDVDDCPCGKPHTYKISGLSQNF